MKHDGHPDQRLVSEMHNSVMNAVFTVPNEELSDVASRKLRHNLATMYLEVAQQGTDLNLMRSISDLTKQEKETVDEFKQTAGTPSILETITMYLINVKGLVPFTKSYNNEISDVIAMFEGEQSGLLPLIENISYSAVLPELDDIISGNVAQIGLDHEAAQVSQMEQLAAQDSTDPSVVRKRVDFDNLVIVEDAPDEDEE
jgi:hypothetical protein